MRELKEIRLKTGQIIKVLPEEIDGLKKLNIIAEEEKDVKEEKKQVANKELKRVRKTKQA